MYTISDLAKQFNLSRSTLLYYDKIGLLTPSERTTANYRVYSENDKALLKQICMYRETGLDLGSIKKILLSPSGKSAVILEKRLEQLNREIKSLRTQQQVIVKMLSDRRLFLQTRVLDKKRWITILRAAGMDEAAMTKWHVAFETISPEAHKDFLESLGIKKNEIQKIRKWSREKSKPD